MKIGDLVKYSPDAREVKAYGIEDQAIGIIAAIAPANGFARSWAKVLWSGHASPDEILIEDLEIIN
tara:strand:+ start:169 stop:366 length:198 start_codon:yes stop_codon:yes gene_type:complete